MASGKPAKYRGSLGRTRSEWVLYSHPEGERSMVEVYRSVDASSDPELAHRLVNPGTAGALNTTRLHDGSPTRTLHVPVLYHDPERSVLVLVLPDSYRHRELEQRAELLQALARDGEAVPDYAANFSTVFGSEGLAEFLRHRVDREVELETMAERLRDERRELDERVRSLNTRSAALDKRTAELSGRTAEMNRRHQELGEREHALSERSDALARRAAAVEQRMMDLAKERAQLQQRAESAPVTPAPIAATEAVTLLAEPAEEPEVSEMSEERPEPAREAASVQAVVSDDEILESTVPTRRLEREELTAEPTSGDSVSRIRPGGAEVQVSVTTASLPADGGAGPSETTQRRSRPDGELDRWLASVEPVLVDIDPSGLTRFAVALDERTLAALGAEHLQVKLQLHRHPAFPVPSLALAPAGALEQDETGPYWCYDFDLQSEAERAILTSLGREFRFALDLFTLDKEPVTRRIVTADLTDNVPYLLEAADAHLTSIERGARSAARAKLALSAPAYDRFGHAHPERANFRDDRLRSLGRPLDVRRALSVARRFSKPEREQYLVLVRGYSLATWRSRRDKCIARAVELGLWIGPRLAHIAIAERMQPSRTQLVETLLRNFEELTASGAHGLDEVAVRENWTALHEEAKSLGISPEGRRRSEPIHSEAEPQVSGTISAARANEATSLEQPMPSDPLIARLEDKDARLGAAIELAHKGEASTLPALFRAVEQMTRGEAGRVLGTIPAFGIAAVPFLITGLGSRKGFIRQGCALGLGVIGGEDATEALCDLLIEEPTEIWREIARAIGIVGASAASALVARARKSPDQLERTAWALANVQVVSDGARVVESLARGRDPVAAQLAERAGDLARQAKVEDASVRAAKAGREVTVNRAFSRRFFESMGGDAVPTAMPGVSRSAPAVLLDEADLLDARDLDEDEAELLDESDLIPT